MKKELYNALNDVLLILSTILLALSLITNQVSTTLISLFLMELYKKGDIDES